MHIKLITREPWVHVMHTPNTYAHALTIVTCSQRSDLSKSIPYSTSRLWKKNNVFRVDRLEVRAHARDGEIPTNTNESKDNIRHCSRNVVQTFCIRHDNV